MKRSGGSKAGNPDFKRLKAKVGKRAPKKLNATDTSFKTASIRVAPQIQSLQRSDVGDSSLGNVVELVSVKAGGKNLQVLAETLSHHAPAARKSALSGIRDIISQCSTSHQENIRDLVVYVLALLARHACVDEDEEVRESARLGLTSIFAALMHRQESDEDAIYVIQPFVPLLSAYLLSGLNSLDSVIRRDAVAVSELCFVSFPRAFGDGRAHSMIPAFLKVLSSTRRTLCATSKKQKKKKSQENVIIGGISKDLTTAANVVGSRVATVRALTVIMRASDRASNDDSGITTSVKGSFSHPCNFNFVPGGIGSNALLLTRKHPSRLAKSSLFCGNEQSPVDLSMIFDEKDKRNPINAINNEERISLSTRIDFLKKLRDYWVELMQTGIKHGTGIAIRLGGVNEASAILQAMSVFWRQYCKPDLAEKPIPSQNSELLKLKKVAQGIITLQLQDFPIRDDSGNIANINHYNALNATLCSFLSEVGSTIGSTDWVEAAFGYIFQRLKAFSEDFSDGDSNSGAKLIMLIRQLLRKPSDSIRHDYLLAPKQRWDLLTAFTGPFFPDENFVSGAKKVANALFTSHAGKNAAILIADLIVEQGVAIADEGIAISRELIRNAHVFPFYLQAWGGDSAKETSIVLESLLFICRKWGGTNGIENHANQGLSKLITFLQHEGLDMIFASGKKRKQKRTASSAFEKMDGSNQEKVISLLGMIQSPSTGVVKSLSDIIIRNGRSPNEEGVSKNNIQFIFEVLHANRKCIALPEYLTFIMSSSGISILKKKYAGGVGTVDVFSYDDAVERTSNAIVNCGGFKIIPKVCPILLDWLSHVSEFESASHVEAILARSGVTLLAKCALDLKDQDDDLLFSSCRGLKNSIIEAVCNRLLLYNPLMEQNESDMIGEKQFRKKFFKSLICLLDSIPLLWCQMLDTTANFVQGSCSKREEDFDNMADSKIDGIKKSETMIQSILFLLNECHVDSILQTKLLCSKFLEFSGRIMETFSNISTSFPSLHSLGQKLNITVRLMIGVTN